MITIQEALEDIGYGILDQGKRKGNFQEFICHFKETKKVDKVIVNIWDWENKNIVFDNLVRLPDCGCDAYYLMVEDGHYINEYILGENGGKY
ncbi:hypothetical protein ACFWMS_25375 [Peribacillus butanolivorans]|uniref:hypothetical protein n=1 Tax=Peribacillus butanolivorans TaxID=421767 RepID=UPI0036529296